MPEIVLVTLNASFAHPAVGLRCLFANLGSLQARAKILEFDLAQRPVDVAERILAEKPKIVGLGVYIWNAGASGELVALLQQIAPAVRIILGGPEVSYETADQEIVARADYTICGEGDIQFRAVCDKLLAGREFASKIIAAEPPDLAKIVPPYAFYTDADIAHRNLYVESSRGCPFGCEFCLSSLDAGVRFVPLEDFLRSMERLLERGVKRFKFLDRTFNLNAERCVRILSFFLERYQPGMFLHFEMVPEYLPESLGKLLASFPPGAVQLEIGIQTFNPEVAERIHRRLDVAQTVANLTWLREQTGVHIHADLIVGLPGESLESFGAGFDRLAGLRPQEIQVGLLKRLRGTAIGRHDAEYGMVYNPQAPYELLCNRNLDFTTVQRLRRFARYWDLTANSGNFPRCTRLLLCNQVAIEASKETGDPSLSRRPWAARNPPQNTPDVTILPQTYPTSSETPFARFLAWSDFLYQQTGQTHGIALTRLAEVLFTYLTGPRGLAVELVARELWQDYQDAGRSDRPKFLRAYLPEATGAVLASPAGKLPQRQARHLRKDR